VNDALPIPTEDQVHVAVLDWLRLALPREAVIFHIANEQLAGPKRLGKLKKLGLQTGVPDLCVVLNGAHFIEFKRPGKDATEEQKAVHKRLRQAGCRVAVVRSLDEMIGHARAWGLIAGHGLAERTFARGIAPSGGAG
jgi:hypothetical protein